MTKRAALLALSMLCSIMFAVPATAGITPEQKCASAKMKAVGKKYSEKAKCYAKALSQTAAVSTDCLQLAESKFNAAFTKAEAAEGCLHDGDAAGIEAKIDQNLADIVGDIGCGNGRTEGDEQCDDGNLVDGDGCTSTCTTPTCTLDGGACANDADCCSLFCSTGTCVVP